MAYQLGNTVRLTAIFKDWAEQTVDPTLIQVKLYTSNWTPLSTYSVGIEDKLASGAYYCDITIPANYRTKVIYVEWYAEIDGTPSIKRIALAVDMI